MSWNKTIHDFGVVKGNANYECSFIYNGPKKIKSARASCGCAATVIKGSVINVNIRYKRGSYSSNKQIMVNFEDNTKEKLSLKAIVR